jgi:hypothetical protein
VSVVDLEVGTIELLADWLETSLLISASGHFALDRVLTLVDEELNIAPERTSMAVGVMEKRADALADLYPFEVMHGLAIMRRREAKLQNAYATLLFLTPASIARQAVPGLSTTDMGELLEEIAEQALANLWGQGGDAVRFGYPSRYGRPQDFNQAVEWLAKRIGIEPGRGYRPPRRKDGGVDVVAWRRFVDKRPGFPVALAQCTIQEEAFTKTTDIDTRLWATWLAMDSDPMSLLVLPGTVRRAGPEWSQLTSVVTVVERLRLAELLGRGGGDTAIEWTSSVLGQLRKLLAAAEI